MTDTAVISSNGAETGRMVTKEDKIRAPKDHPMVTPAGRIRTTKLCQFCGRYKRPEYFYLDDEFTFGLSFWCVACCTRLADD